MPRFFARAGKSDFLSPITITYQLMNVQNLYCDHHHWLVGWLRRRLRCHDDAADLAQDTFVRVLGRTDRLADLREPRAWLSSIARGLMIDRIRRRELERAWLETCAQLPEAEVPTPEDQMMIVEMLVIIDDALRGLKPRVRKTFFLARLEGLTCPQIAEQLGVSRATVERDLASALRSCYQARFCVYGL